MVPEFSLVLTLTSGLLQVKVATFLGGRPGLLSVMTTVASLTYGYSDLLTIISVVSLFPVYSLAIFGWTKQYHPSLSVNGYSEKYVSVLISYISTRMLVSAG